MRLASPAVLLASVFLGLAACAADLPPTGSAVPTRMPGFEEVDGSRPRDLPAHAGPMPAGDGTGWLPASEPIEHGVAYRFSLGHCGLHSPVDVDGSLWDAIDGVTASGAPLDLENDGEMINATMGHIVVIGDEARFRTESGAIVRFERHAGEKTFPPCM